MSKIKGTVVVTGVITPGDNRDDFPVIDPKWGVDGMRSCNDMSEMYEIVPRRRRKGMLVAVPAFDNIGDPILNEDSGHREYFIWQLLNNPPTALTQESDWVLWQRGGGDDKHYTHTQSTPSMIWTVNHNLDKFPSIGVTVFNEPGVVAIPAVRHIDKNSCEVFVGNNPILGYAYCN